MSNITRHSSWLIISFIITALLNYVFGVTLSWFFTPAQFGLLGVAQSLLLVLALIVGSGFAWTAAHDVAAEGVTPRTRRRFRAAWLANVALGVFLAAALWLAYATGRLPLGPGYRAVIPLVGFTTVVLAARSVLNGAARGLYRFGPIAVNLSGEVVIKVGVGLALVAAGMGVAGVMAGFAVGALAALAHSLWMVWSARLWRGAGRFDGAVLSATAPLFLGMLGPVLMLNFDLLGLKLLAPAGQGDELAGYYQAAVILARTPVFIAQSLTLVLFSYAAGAASRAKKPGPDGTSGYVLTVVRAWGIFLLPGGLALMLAPQAALALFFPPHYQAAAPTLRISAAGGVLLALVTLLNGVFQAGTSRRRPALAAGLAMVAQAAALVTLVPRLGAAGAAWSLLAGGGAALLGLAPALIPHLGLRLHFAWPKTVLPLAALAFPLLVLTGTTAASAALKLGLAGLAYLAALLALRLPLTGLAKAGAGARPAMGNSLINFIAALIGE
ncbi:MAG: oligosaccharide flippase family protein [Anaerolineae bacterium]